MAVAALQPAYARAEAHSSPRRLYYSVLGLALAAAIVPLWLVRFPMLADYPAHLARCYILAHFHANPLWQHVYRVAWGPIPNLAIDAIVTPLAHWLPIGISGKIFLTLMAILYVGGCDALGRAAWGERHAMALVAGCSFLNTCLLAGMVNYVFGLALALWVLACWLRWRRHMTPRRFMLLCAMSLLVYGAHLGAVAVLGVACTTIALLDFFTRHRRVGALIADAGWMACPTLLLLLGFLRHNGRVGHVLWNTWEAKASQAISFMTQTFNLHFDAAMLIGFAVCAGVLLWHARWQRELGIAALVLLVCYLVAPWQIFTSTYADARFLAPAYVLLILAVRPRRGRLHNAALFLVIALMLARAGFLAQEWIAAQPEAEQIVMMGNVLPAGARVDAPDGVGGKTGATGFQRLQLDFLAASWSVTRGVYMSNLYAAAGQQPLVQRPNLKNCWPSQPGCLEHFDYVLADRPPAADEARLQAAAVPVARTGTFVLWRIRTSR